MSHKLRKSIEKDFKKCIKKQSKRKSKRKSKRRGKRRGKRRSKSRTRSRVKSKTRVKSRRRKNQFRATGGGGGGGGGGGRGGSKKKPSRLSPSHLSKLLEKFTNNRSCLKSCPHPLRGYLPCCSGCWRQQCDVPYNLDGWTVKKIRKGKYFVNTYIHEKKGLQWTWNFIPEGKGRADIITSVPSDRVYNFIYGEDKDGWILTKL